MPWKAEGAQSSQSSHGAAGAAADGRRRSLTLFMVEEISAHENYVDIALHVELLFIFLLTCKVYVRTVTEVRLAGAVLHYK